MYSLIYTIEEKKKIKDLANSYNVTQIAKKLGRTESGIKAQMIEMGVSVFQKNSGVYSAKALGELLGVSYEVVRRWINNHSLPATKKALNEGVKERFQRYHICAEDFWQWATNHKELIDCSKFEKHALPPEPEWVDKKRRIDRKKIKPKTWSDEEDLLVIKLFYFDSLDIQSIADRTQRTYNSIEKRLMILRKSGKVNEYMTNKVV
jgi:IS30 family transposase